MIAQETFNNYEIIKNVTVKEAEYRRKNFRKRA